jgi:hypothetical protein
MGRIYQKSSLNISAVMATSANTGCFPDFAKGRNWPLFIGTMHCDPQTPKHPPHADRLYAEVVFPVGKHPKNSFRPRSPLDSRGWTDSRVMCFGLGEFRATVCCLALFPTQICFLVNPSSKVAEFQRVGLGIWPLASWDKLLGGSEGLGGLERMR